MTATAATRWPWWIGPLTVLAALLVAGLLGGVAAAAAGPDFSRSYPHWAGLAQDAAWIAIAITVPWLVTGRARAGDFGLTRPSAARAVLTFTVAALTFIAFSASYAALAGVGGEPNEKLAQTGFGESTVRDAAFVVLYAAAAPLAEELLFRSVLFGSLRQATGPWGAALVTGGLFGVLHLGAGQDDLIPALVAFGAILALTYHYSGSLYVAIALHAANNAVATASQASFTQPWIWGLLVAGPAIALFGAWALTRVPPLRLNVRSRVDEEPLPSHMLPR